MARLQMTRWLVLVVTAATTLWATDTSQVRNRAGSGSVRPGAACSTTLPDGRSFLTGGSTPDNPLATASFFRKDGQLTAAAPMLAPRAAHVCIALKDGSLLIAGGLTGPGGPTSSAEIYQPDTNLWTTTGAMLTARTNAAAILLSSGNVLVTGGQTSGRIANTLEIYDPATGRFRLAAGVLSSPRARHAIAVLKDGRVLIAGGFDGSQTDGTQTMDTIDIFDPESETVRPAGFMLSRRSDFTATTLADGRILLAGGFDGSNALASAEVWDPATATSTAVSPLAAPRRNHIAIRPPGSENVLIAGGSARDAEIFVPSRNAFMSAREATAVDTTTVTVGALDATGKPNSVRVYAIDPVAPAVK